MRALMPTMESFIFFDVLSLSTIASSALESSTLGYSNLFI